MVAIILITLSTFFIAGIIGRSRSILSGRKGPRILQPIYNILLLLRKGSVYSNSSSYITQYGPIFSVCGILTATLFIPFVNHKSVFSFDYDFVLFAFLLAFSRFALLLTAFDSGSSFEGMGTAREALYGMLLEPAFFVIMASLALITGFSSFEDIFSGLAQFNIQYVLFAFLSVYVYFNFALIETSRLPVDDPKTHLELTMIHEVMVLDLSGFELAMVQIGTLLKFSIFGLLISNLLIPLSWPIYYQVLLFIAIQILFASSIGILESFRARNRMNKNAQYIISISAVALLSFLLSMFLSK